MTLKGRLTRACFVWLLVSITVSPGISQTLPYDLIIESEWLSELQQENPKDGVASALLRLFEGIPKPERIFLPVFTNGQTLFPTQSSLFKVNPSYAGKDILSEMIEKSHQHGVQVYALFDCLLWVRPGTPKEQDIFLKHPQLQEVNAEGSSLDEVEGKFASPFNPQVQSVLVELIKEVATKYPDLDGLFLRECRLSTYELLGYSEAARKAFQRIHPFDPASIRLDPINQAETKALQTFMRWRHEQMAEFVRALSAAWRSQKPNTPIATQGLAVYYDWQEGKDWVLQDWLGWAERGYVDEVVLEGHWQIDKLSRAYRKATGLLVQRTKENMVVPLVKPYTDYPFIPSSINEAPINKIAIVVPAANRWLAIKEFIQLTEFIFVADFDLMREPQLRKKALVNATSSAQALKQISHALGVPLESAPVLRHKEVYIRLNLPVATVMRRLAVSVGGFWRKKGNGYYLDERPDRDRIEGDHLLWEEKKPQEALAAYKRAIEKGMDVRRAWFGMGRAYELMGKPQDAIAPYSEAIKLDEGFTDAYLARGESYLTAGKPDEAIADFKKVLQLQPGHALAHIRIGNVYMKKKDLKEAVQWFEKALPIVEKMPEKNYWLAWTHYWLGESYLSLRQRDRALEHLKRCLAIEPKHSGAQALLKQMGGGGKQ